MTDDLQAPAVARYGTPAQLAVLRGAGPASTCRCSPRPTPPAPAPRRGWSRPSAAATLAAATLDAGARRVLALRAPRASPAGPGPSGTPSRPWLIASAPSGGAPLVGRACPSVASPHGSSTFSAAAQCTRGGDPQRPVERRGDVDLGAGRPHQRRLGQQRADPARARDLQADRVGRAAIAIAPCSAAVSSIAIRTGTRSRTARSSVIPRDRLLDQLQARPRQRLDRVDRLVDRPRAVGVQRAARPRRRPRAAPPRRGPRRRRSRP